MKHKVLYAAIITALIVAGCATYQFINGALSTNSYMCNIITMALVIYNSANTIRMCNKWKPIDWSKP